jgi:hypothetical protein
MPYLYDNPACVNEGVVEVLHSCHCILNSPVPYKSHLSRLAIPAAIKEGVLCWEQQQKAACLVAHVGYVLTAA